MELVEKTYCKFVHGLDVESLNPNKKYHDTEYGFPVEDDRELFARLVLEINQAGLSWSQILHKKDNFYQAYDNFNIAKVASYQNEDFERLLNNSGIIRNKLKIKAAIFNAQQILLIQRDFGSFKQWLDLQHPKSKEDWVLLFKKNFKFTGGEIVNEFLMSTGYLAGAHQVDCPTYAQVLKCKPKWYETLNIRD